MDQEKPVERIFSEIEAAAILGMSSEVLAKRRRAGKIGHIRDGRYYIRFLQRHIDAYLASCDNPRLPAEERRQLRREEIVRKRSQPAQSKDKNYGLSEATMILMGPKWVAEFIAEAKELERAKSRGRAPNDSGGRPHNGYTGQDGKEPPRE